MALPQRYNPAFLDRQLARAERPLVRDLKVPSPRPAPGCCESRQTYESFVAYCRRVGIVPMGFERWAAIRAKQERQLCFRNW